jgi:hypothetical protein
MGYTTHRIGGEQLVDTKPSQQHRQHFNLSEAAKQMLEELTMQRYPGKQRRQSQVIEDLIIEAYTKSRNRSGIPASISEGAYERAASSTNETHDLSQQEAVSLGAIPHSATRDATTLRSHHIAKQATMGSDASTLSAGTTVAQRLVAEAGSAYTATHQYHCSSCHREVLSDWKHCIYCGTPLTLRCAHCGAPKAEVAGARFCFECGSPI